MEIGVVSINGMRAALRSLEISPDATFLVRDKGRQKPQRAGSPPFVESPVPLALLAQRHYTESRIWMWCPHYMSRCAQVISKAFFIEVRWDYPLLADLSKAFLYFRKL